MGRFALLECLVTLGVLFLIFKTACWIGRLLKNKTDKVDESLKEEKKRRK